MMIPPLMRTIVALLLQLPVRRIILIAVMVKLTGLSLTMVWINRGNVFVGMKALDKKVSTKIMIIDKLPINSAFFAIKPTKAKIHEVDQPMKIANNRTATSVGKPTVGRHPIKKAVVKAATPESKSRKLSPTN